MQIYTFLFRSLLLVFTLNLFFAQNLASVTPSDYPLPERALYYMSERARELDAEGDHKSADALRDELQKKAQEWDLPAWTAHSSWQRGSVRQRREGIESAIPFYEEALRAMAEARERGRPADAKQEWILRNNLQRGYTSEGRLNLARRMHGQMEEHTRRSIGYIGGNLLQFDVVDQHVPLVAMQNLNEVRYQIMQGLNATALDNLERLCLRLQGLDSLSSEAMGALAMAFSGRIRLHVLVGEYSEAEGIFRALQSLPESEGVDYFRYAELARLSYIRILQDETSFDSAWNDVTTAVEKFYEFGVPEMAISTEVYLPVMLAAVGRTDEAAALLQSLQDQAAETHPRFARYFQAASIEVMKHLGEGNAADFWQTIARYRQTGDHTSVSHVYESYAGYLYAKGEHSEAIRYARLGDLHVQMFEDDRIGRNLRSSAEAWTTDREEDLSPGTDTFIQPKPSSEFTLTSPIRPTPLDFFTVEYRLPLVASKMTVNIRARSDQTVRLEYIDPTTGRLIAVDNSADGEFEGIGDIAFRDTRRDGHPELTPSKDELSPTLKLRVFPHPNPTDRPAAISPLTLTLEFKGESGWERWADTQVNWAPAEMDSRQ